MKTIIFQTERLTARTWEETDLPLALELWGDPEVIRLIDLRGQLNEQQVQERLSTEIDRQQKLEIQYWPLFEKSSGQFIGCCGLRPRASNLDQIELGYHILKKHWGKGFATEAAQGAIDYARNKLKLKQLYAGHHPHNAQSKKVLLKLGFQHLEDRFYEPTGLYHSSYVLDL